MNDGFEVSFDDGVVAVGLAEEQRADGRDGSLGLDPTAQFAMLVIIVGVRVEKAEVGELFILGIGVKVRLSERGNRKWS